MKQAEFEGIFYFFQSVFLIPASPKYLGLNWS